MFRIETLARQSGRDAFHCGDPELDRWLREDAGQSDRRGTTLTRVALDPTDDRVVGYYATKAYQLEGAELAAALGLGTVRYPVPCLLLARLARCQSVRGQGVGELLMAHALRAATRVSMETGLQFVVVHAIDDHAAQFYERYGFERFIDHPLHLLIPLKTVRMVFPA